MAQSTIFLLPLSAATATSDATAEHNPAVATTAAVTTVVAAIAMTSDEENEGVIFPETHKWPEDDRPKVKHDGYEQGLDLPMVDLLDDKVACLHNLNKACSEWGFFQLLNHGIPAQTVNRMENISRSFFTLPTEEKIRVAEGTPNPRLYDRINRKQYTACSWVEGLNIHDFSTIPHIATRAWPESSEDICATFSDYLDQMYTLGGKLVQLLIASLGVDDEDESAIPIMQGKTGIRFNFYPKCPQPSMALGVVPHTDPNSLTILHQDHVGGLQICKDGKWIAVKPVQNAFVVNIGDSFQAWSNRRYKSVVHRAVVNKTKSRISIAFIYGPRGDYCIYPPHQLIDEQHPVIYRPFKYNDYLAWRKTTNFTGTKAFETYADVDFITAA